MESLGHSNPSTPIGGSSKRGAEADLKSSNKKGLVLITGLPESGWSESDIISMVQPFGMPFDIIMATQIGRVLLSVSDMETAQEMVKVHSFRPAKIRDTEVKMTHIKQNIGLSTPVALYNLLMATGAPFESPAPISWAKLLVISNVPVTPSGPSDVQKLVRRFGTVIKTLVLNSMVICEMATVALAQSVYKRFQTFPCIIHNNPLFFSRKADPRANAQSKVITAYLDPLEVTPANVKSSKTSAAGGEEEMPAGEDSGPPLEVMGKYVHGKEEMMNVEEKLVGDKALEENQSKDQEQEVKEEALTANVSESLAALDTQPGSDCETRKMEIAEEDNDASMDRRAKPAADEETKTSDGRATSSDTHVPESPQASLEMVDAWQEKSQTSTGSNSNNQAEAPANRKQEETQPEKKQVEQSGSQPQQLTKNQAEEETKKQKRELKEKEVRKERERKEKEKKERERRAWDSKERVRKERDRDERGWRERERREEERREREKRERKRMHGEGWRSFSKSEGNKRSTERDGQNKKSETANQKVEEELDEFPFNMSDFVTVDEVGDVTDLPDSPPAAVLMEIAEEGKDSATAVQKDLFEEAPTEANAEAGKTYIVTAAPLEPEPEPGAEAVNDQVSSTPDQLSDFPHSQTVPTRQPAAPKTETKQTTLMVSPLTMSAGSSNSTELGRAEGEEEREEDSALNEVKEEKGEDAFSEVKEQKEERDDTLSGVQEEKEEDEDTFSGVKEEKEVEDSFSEIKEQKRKEPMEWNKTEDSGKTQEEEEEKARSSATGKHQRSEDRADTKEESAWKKLKTETPNKADNSFPPFDPSNPVGMEFLVQKTGFFCKVCNRFFSGNKQAEISHCKTLKHYESLRKFLQTRKMMDLPAHHCSS